MFPCFFFGSFSSVCLLCLSMVSLILFYLIVLYYHFLDAHLSSKERQKGRGFRYGGCGGEVGRIREELEERKL